MLQFSTTLCTAAARLAPRSSWRLTALVANSSTVTTSNPATSVKEDDSNKFSEMQDDVLPKTKQEPKEVKVNGIILHSPEKEGYKMNNAFAKQFERTQSINDLLDLATISNLSTYNALKLISRITNQINSGESQIVDIEADERFIHLRKIVKAGNDIKTGTKQMNDDLVHYSQLSTPAMIAVMASLREQRNRNTPLLRMLSYNIVKYNSKLSLKQCASLLYSMAILNFPDKILLEKIMGDLLDCIPKTSSAVTNRSIITSLGFLYYKNENVLDAFCDTMINESIKYKPQDYLSILQTFAALQYKSERIKPFIEKFIDDASLPKKRGIEWLDIVWSLAALDIAEAQHVKSVLGPSFLATFEASKINVSKILKLLNINGVAEFMIKNYNGPFLNTNAEILNVSLTRANEKQVYVDALTETLSKVLPSAAYFKTDIDTNVGVLLDAEYRIDADHKLIKVENWDKQSENVKRIAIMLHDYHDYCRGQNDLKGSTYLYTQLLKAKGYDLITISYENFSTQDKLEKRIFYLKQCMKTVHKIQSI